RRRVHRKCDPVSGSGSQRAAGEALRSGIPSRLRSRPPSLSLSIPSDARSGCDLASLHPGIVRRSSGSEERNVNPEIFREYDIPGLVDRDLTVEVVEQLGLGLGTMVKRGGGRSVVVGRDCRESSTRFREALCRGITSTGLHVLDVGIVPTPLTYFAANTLP